MGGFIKIDQYKQQFEIVPDVESATRIDLENIEDIGSAIIDVVRARNVKGLEWKLCSDFAVTIDFDAELQSEQTRMTFKMDNDNQKTFIEVHSEEAKERILKAYSNHDPDQQPLFTPNFKGDVELTEGRYGRIKRINDSLRETDHFKK